MIKIMLLSLISFFILFQQVALAVPRALIDSWKPLIVVVKISESSSIGSGFFISSDGYILTCAHVINSDKLKGIITVKNYDGKEFNARIIDMNLFLDIALLKIDSEDLVSYFEFGESSKIQFPHEVTIIGHPSKGGFQEYWDSESYRITSIGKFGNFRLKDDLFPGQSGAPVINDQGKIIAVAAGRSESFPESYVIPINFVSSFVQTYFPGKDYRPEVKINEILSKDGRLLKFTKDLEAISLKVTSIHKNLDLMIKRLNELELFVKNHNHEALNNEFSSIKDKVNNLYQKIGHDSDIFKFYQKGCEANVSKNYSQVSCIFSVKNITEIEQTIQIDAKHSESWDNENISFGKGDQVWIVGRGGDSSSQTIIPRKTVDVEIVFKNISDRDLKKSESIEFLRLQYREGDSQVAKIIKFRNIPLQKHTES